MSKIKTKKLINVIKYDDVGIDFLDENYNSIELPECETEEEEIKQYEKAKTSSDIVGVHCFECGRHTTYFFLNKENQIDVMPDEGEKLTFKELVTAINLVSAHMDADKRHLYNVCIGLESEEGCTCFAQDSSINGYWWNDLFKLYVSHQRSVNNLSIYFKDNKILVEFW